MGRHLIRCGFCGTTEQPIAWQDMGDGRVMELCAKCRQNIAEGKAREMDTPIAYDLAMEYRDGEYYIVEYAVLENGSRVEMFSYKAHDEQVAQIRHWSSWPPGSASN